MIADDPVGVAVLLKFSWMRGIISINQPGSKVCVMSTYLVFGIIYAVFRTYSFKFI